MTFVGCVGNIVKPVTKANIFKGKQFTTYVAVNYFGEKAPS